MIFKSTAILILSVVVFICSIAKGYCLDIPDVTSVPASEVVINGTAFEIGKSELHDYLNKRDEFIYKLHFPAPKADINVNYLLNATRVFLKNENVVTLQGHDIDRLTVELNRTEYSPLTIYSDLLSFTAIGGKLSQADTGSFLLEVPVGASAVSIIPVANDSNTTIMVNDAVVESDKSSGPILISNGQTIVIQTTNQNGGSKSYNIRLSENSSLSSTLSYRSLYFKADFPQSSFVRIMNTGDSSVSFQMNLNDSLVTSIADLVSEIVSLPDEFYNEPIERKVWRFIVDNRYHFFPLSGELWYHGPALFFNSTGFGYCDDAASVYYHIMAELGFTARVWGLGGHVVPEVFVNGRWEMYDADMEVYYLKQNGEIAGVEELELNPGLISNPINPISNYNDGLPYSSLLKSFYASVEDNAVSPWYHGGINPAYQLKYQLPPAGVLEFPYIFDSSLQTLFNTFAPRYTNARILIPKDSTFDADIPLVVHSITPAPAQLGLEVVVDKLSPVIPGTAVTFSASASGGSGNYEYYFRLYNPNSKMWHVQGYSGNDTWVWDTSGLAPGCYTIEVRARNVGTSGLYEAHKIFYYSSPVSQLSVSMDNASPHVSGTVVTFTASAAGGSGRYEYYFKFYNPNTQQWSVGQAYSVSNTWVWNTTGLAPGSYSIEVRTRNVGTNVNNDVYKSFRYEIIADPPPVSQLSVSMDNASPHVSGTVVTFTASAAGGSGQYVFL